KTDTKILGDTAYASVFNPATGKFESHVQQFDVPNGSLVDFGNGKIMTKNIGPDGKATYTDASPKTLPTSAQEYEYAKTQGYKGSYTQYQNEDANRKRSVSTTINNGASDALLAAITNGTIDPNRVNSRTLPLFNAIAKAGVDAVSSHA